MPRVSPYWRYIMFDDYEDYLDSIATDFDEGELIDRAYETWKYEQDEWGNNHA